MAVCVCGHVFIPDWCVYICVCVYVSICTCVCVWVHMCVWEHVCVYVSVIVSICTVRVCCGCVYVSFCMCAWMCARECERVSWVCRHSQDVEGGLEPFVQSPVSLCVLCMFQLWGESGRGEMFCMLWWSPSTRTARIFNPLHAHTGTLCYSYDYCMMWLEIIQTNQQPAYWPRQTLPLLEKSVSCASFCSTHPASKAWRQPVSGP